MDRRQFLKCCGAGLGAWMAGLPLGRLALAAQAKDRYFVFCYFEGGWDLLLALDPRDPLVFTPQAAAETGIEPGYHLLPPDLPHAPLDAGPFMLGPCAGELAELADHFSVVRGVNMATLTHEVGRRYFLTGRPPSGTLARGSSVASVATAQIGDDRPVPNLAHRVETYAVDLPSYAAALSVGAVAHVQYLLRETLGIPNGIPDSVRKAVQGYWKEPVTCDDDAGAGAGALAQLYRENRERAEALVKSGLHSQFVFESPALASVREHYGFTVGTVESPAGRAALAAQAIKSGLSRVVSVALSTNLDTHDGTWAGQHSTRLEDGMNALARLITDLRDTEAPGGGSMLSRTTIVAFSEFGRTPRLNSRQGRDHHIGNCALLAGAGVMPGIVAGASSDLALGPELIDLASGKPDPTSGISLKPEHVMSTVLACAGLDAAPLQSEPIPSLLAPKS